MHVYNSRKEIKLDQNKYSSVNPINKTNVKRKKINGEYIYERFYLIDFTDIKENSYVISSFGRIFSLITDKELKPYRNPKRNNYQVVILRDKDGKARKHPLHALVARAFIPKTVADKKMERIYVHHKNWDNDYNYYWNLEWRSPMEINMIGILQTKKDLEEDEIVKMVCKLFERGTTIVDTFQIIGGRISKDKLSKIKNKTLYTHISKDYKF